VTLLPGHKYITQGTFGFAGLENRCNAFPFQRRKEGMAYVFSYASLHTGGWRHRFQWILEEAHYHLTSI
jgi:hypothetical protein